MEKNAPTNTALYEAISALLQSEGITCFAALPLSECRLTRPYLAERAGIPAQGSAVMMAVPYLCPEALTPDCNLSAYAVGRDYHLFFSGLFARLCKQLSERFPDYRFAGCADHSPIDERDAACKAGLGVRGKNGLLLTTAYSSFVFLGELLTDAVLPGEAQPIRTCIGCNRCLSACPITGTDRICLSALTQKKGTPDEEETAQLRAHPLVWGCDICQTACPYTQNAIRRGTAFSTIPFFHERLIPHLTVSLLDGMSDADFSERAYAWRGRPTIRRNLLLKEEDK